MVTPQSYISQVESLRRSVGLPPDPVSDRIWAERMADGTASFGEAERRIEAKARDQGVRNRDTPGYPDVGVGSGESDPVDPADAARQQRMSNRESMRDVLAWLPEDLTDAYIDEWVKTGDPQLAWAQVRTSDQYGQHFPGIRRDDGTLRMSEQEYLAHREGFRRELTQWGLNPDVFESRHPQLIEGDVGVSEFSRRLTAVGDRVMQNLPQVREQFAEFYGDDVSDEALIGVALDPDVGEELLQGRITASQIAGEAENFGFDRDRDRAESLAFAGSLDQEQARELFSSAASNLPRLSRFARRYNTADETFGVGEFEESQVFGDPEQTRRIRRLGAFERAQFRRGGRVRRDDSGLVGLEER